MYQKSRNLANGYLSVAVTIIFSYSSAIYDGDKQQEPATLWDTFNFIGGAYWEQTAICPRRWHYLAVKLTFLPRDAYA